MIRPSATALLLLALAACGSPREAGDAGAETRDGSPREAPPAPAPPPGPAAAAPAPETPAPDTAVPARDTLPALRLVSREPLGGRTPRDLGLTGANKPNPLAERFRRGVPPETPDWVPRRLDGLDLTIADSTEEGWLAFYRGPLELRPGGENARFRAALFAPGGRTVWDVDLNRHLSRPDRLEVQDLRYADGELYFNEACQSYSREAGGRCSSLVSLDPRTGRVAWRTRPRVSNNVFVVSGPWVVSGYGFTAEPDSVFLVDRRTGRIAARAPLDSAPSYLEAEGPRISVLTTGSAYTFRLVPQEVTSR